MRVEEILSLATATFLRPESWDRGCFRAFQDPGHQDRSPRAHSRILSISTGAHLPDKQIGENIFQVSGAKFSHRGVHVHTGDAATSSLEGLVGLQASWGERDGTSNMRPLSSLNRGTGTESENRSLPLATESLSCSGACVGGCNSHYCW